MSVPDYQGLMQPLMAYARDGHEHSLRETIDALADRLGLTEKERNELLPSGRQARFANRVGWARTYLSKAGLLQDTRRGHFQITDRGKEVFDKDGDQLCRKYLERFPEFREFTARRRRRAPQQAEVTVDDDADTPEETIEAAHQRLRDELSASLLEAILDCSPAFFERLVVDLLVAMGYGGSRRDAGQAMGRSGDEGIDGIINEDRLGLDVVYIQAKRWRPETTVGRPEIQKFAGALQGHRARKGVFISTCAFTAEARQYVSRIDSKVVLIDGERLTELMQDFGIGVTRVVDYTVNRLDADYFADE